VDTTDRLQQELSADGGLSDKAEEEKFDKSSALLRGLSADNSRLQAELKEAHAEINELRAELARLKLSVSGASREDLHTHDEQQHANHQTMYEST